MASLIPDSVTATFSQLIDAYSQVEAIKLQKRLADAKISLASSALPSYPSDPQAKATDMTIQQNAPQMSGALLLGLGLAAAVAVYVIVKPNGN